MSRRSRRRGRGRRRRRSGWRQALRPFRRRRRCCGLQGRRNRQGSCGRLWRWWRGIRRRENRGGGRRGRRRSRVQLERGQRRGDCDEACKGQTDRPRTGAENGLVHDAGNPSLQSLGVGRHGERDRVVSGCVGRQADQGPGVEAGIDVPDGLGVSRVLGGGGKVGVQLPDQGVEPEDGQHEPRQHQEQPVAASDMGHLVRQDGGRRLRRGETDAVDQDGPRRHAPTQRTAHAGARQQGRPSACNKIVQRRLPRLASDGLGRLRPAPQQTKPHQQPGQDGGCAQGPDPGQDDDRRWPQDRARDRHSGDGTRSAGPQGLGRGGVGGHSRQDVQPKRRRKGGEQRQGQEQDGRRP